MTWFGWVFIALTVFDVLGRVALVGTERKYTRERAVADVLFNLVILVGVLVVGTGRM